MGVLIAKVDGASLWNHAHQKDSTFPPHAQQASFKQLSFIFKKRKLGLGGSIMDLSRKINGDFNCVYELPKP